MKKSWWPPLLLAAGFAALSLLAPGGPDILSALALPFAWLGSELRALSLSGTLGNLLALLLYALLSLLPAGILLVKRTSIQSRGTRWLLAAMSGYLFFLLYFMINPSQMAGLFHPDLYGLPEVIQVWRVSLCSVFYTLLMAWWMVGALAKKAQIYRIMRQLLCVLGAILLYSVFYTGLAQLRQTFQAVDGADRLMAVVDFFHGAVPALLLLPALYAASRLLWGLAQNFFSKENQAAATEVAKWCRASILSSVIAMLARNGLQLLIARQLRHVNLAGSAPVTLLLAALCMLLFSRYLAEGLRVYSENQLMI